MFCMKCGAKLIDGAKFCLKCGAPVAVSSQHFAGEPPAPQGGQPVQPTPHKPQGNPPTEQPVSVPPGTQANGTPQTPPIHQPGVVSPGSSSKATNPRAVPGSQPGAAPNSQPAGSSPSPVGYPGVVPPGVPPKKKAARWPWIVCGVGIAAVILIVAAIIGSSMGQSEESSSPTTSTSSVQNVSLTETYTNEEEGLSFQYPAGWISVSEEEAADYYESFSPENPPIVLLATEEDGDLISTMDVFKYAAAQEDVDWLYSSDEEFSETVPDATWIETSLTELDGVSVRELLTINGDELYSRSYLYLSGAYLYEIRFDCHESYRNDMDPIYDEVLHSCVLTIDQVNIPTSPSPDDLPEGLAWVEKPNVVTDTDIWGSSYITGILQNTSPVPYEILSIEFNLYDASGNQIGTASDYLSNLQAGGTWKFETRILNEDAVRFEFVSVDFFYE